MTTDGTGIYSALKLEETYFIPLAETIEEFIRFDEEGLLNLAKMLEMNKKDQSVIPIPVSQVQIEIPFYPQRNIFCVGKNFEKHAKELSLFQNTLPETPIFFTKCGFFAVRGRLRQARQPVLRKCAAIYPPEPRPRPVQSGRQSA